jgi:MFS family permease
LSDNMTIHIPSYNFFGSGFKLRAAITLACQCAFVLYGYDQGVFSGIVDNEDFLKQFGHPSAGLEGIIVSIYNLGAFSGCVIAFMICEWTGRRLAMWIAICFIIVGGILQATAFTVPHLMIARYITGIGTGMYMGNSESRNGT